jgi:hypothetical protein
MKLRAALASKRAEQLVEQFLESRPRHMEL